MGKAKSRRLCDAAAETRHTLRPTVTALAVAACFSTSVALANPTGGTVVHGTAQITNPAANILNINSLTAQTIINWGGFSIGVGELTRFIQPSALSAVLNRVTGQDPSAILGALQSNGRVFLINPNGITFGAGAQIDVAGLVASTLNLSNDDFLNNRLRFTDGAGAGSVVNQGSITGGSVYLVGKATTNDGLITSPNGEVVLAAGNSVELVNPGTPDLRVEIVAPDNAARNLGTIAAEAGRIGIYAGLIHNSGTLNASSAVAEGGRIMLKSTRVTSLEAGSVTSARGTSGGEIVALSDMASGLTEVAGILDASAIPSANPGHGGFVETSAASVKVLDGAKVRTAGSGGGRSGNWLIDPVDYYISAYGGDISGATLSSNLNDPYGGDITIATDGATAGNGDIFVDDSISWTSNHSLTLLARRNVTINSSIDGGGDLLFYAGWNGGSTTTPVVTDGIGDITSSFDTIQTRGNILFEAGRDILLGASTVGAGRNAANGDASDGLAKSVNLIAGRDIRLTAPDGGADVLAIGNNGSATAVVLQAKTGSIEVTGSEIRAKGGDGVESAGGDAAVTLCTGALSGGVCMSSTTGAITVSNSAIGAIGGSGSSGKRGGDSAVKLTAGTGGIQVSGNGFVSSSSVSRGIYATGGEGNNANNFGEAGGRGGDAMVQLTSNGGITVSGSVESEGGVGGRGNSGSGGRGGHGKVMMNATGDITVADQVSANGGRGGTAFNEGGSGVVLGGRGGDAEVQLVSSGGITVSGQIRSTGGTGGNGSSGLNNGGRGGDGKIMMTAAGTLGVTGPVGAAGGSGGSANSGSNTGGRGGNALVQLESTSAMTVEGSVEASGGWAGNGFGGGGDGGDATVTVVGSSVLIDNSTIRALGKNAASCCSSLATAGGTAVVTITSAGATTLSGGSAIEASGGDGAEGGVAGDGSVIVTAGGGITVSNTIIDASGGWGVGFLGTRQGGAATIVLNATGGNIQMEGAEGTARGGGGDIGGSAVNALISAGNITVSGRVLGSVGAFTTGSTPGAAAVILAAAGDITLDSNAWVWSHGDLGIAGANILQDNARAWGDGSLVVGATGNLVVMNSSELIGGTGNATLGVSGNVTVDNSFIRGNPDVVMSVLGTVNMNNGGVIEAGAPTTIHLAFPLLDSGGYFVNGIEGVVYDELTSTGFRADGSGAVIDTNLFITYGGTAAAPPTDALLVAMGESLEPPEAEKNKDIFAETEDEKKKDAPVCR